MANKFNKIFITGGAGYVGSHLVPSLLDKGYSVVVYDLYIYDYKFPEHKNLVQVKGDIRDKKKMIESSKGCDAMIHLACISNDPSFDLDPKLGKSINYDAFKNVIEACKKNKIKRLVVASSTAQYGIKPEDVEVTEDIEAEPITDYAKYKIECEKLLLNTDIGDTEYVFVRPATLCGYAPRLRLDLSLNILTINGLVNKKIKVFGGDQMRPALNIKDMTRFYELMLEAPKEKIHKQAFNVSYKNMTIKQLAELAKKVLNDKSIIFEITPSDDNRSYHVNTDKMKEVLGFECKYDFEDAVKSLAEAYKKGLIVDGLNNPLYHNIKRMKELNLK
ncbi:NAD(P)-dependent oxidoreductase [Candidatus Woesearchaeota archaeon]|nr:NAD(P)-dependent oxidoreductase [Candidatus Woesearchaeota archaeon]